MADILASGQVNAMGADGRSRPGPETEEKDCGNREKLYDGYPRGFAEA
jgi:hypothetical protein